MVRALLAALTTSITLAACGKASKGTKADEPELTVSKETASADTGEAGTDPIDVAQRCTKNEDCVASREMYIDKAKGSCCHSCNTQPVAKSWLTSAAKDCAKLGSAGCPTKKCAALEAVACIDGRCSLATPGSP